MKAVTLKLHDTTYAELEILLEKLKTHRGE
jgi:hypothetical protein